MYIPDDHAFSDPLAMQAHIDRHPLGAWVCSLPGGLAANHVPFVLDRVLDHQPGPCGRLLGHVSRANTVWQGLADGAPCVVMFTGPHAYITPGWYPGRQAHGRVVPTWNYVTVHAHGVARAVHDPVWMWNMLTRLTDAQEASQTQPWHLSEPPQDYLQGLMQGVVGIEITIQRLEGRLKLSQDEALADRHGTVAGLSRQACPHAQALAALVQAQITDGS